jgi:hypothetical protein
MIKRNFAAGVIHLLRVCAGERVLGYLYNLRLGNRIYAYQSGSTTPIRARGRES